jgi:hypothetical protein
VPRAAFALPAGVTLAAAFAVIGAPLWLSAAMGLLGLVRVAAGPARTRR